MFDCVTAAPFIPPPSPPPPSPPPPLWLCGPTVLYNDMSPYMPYVPGPHPASPCHMPMFQYRPVFYTIDLRSKIVRQINYYFSNDNLAKDIYLRQRMDADGWVPITLIANFNKIKELTNDVSFILNALKDSTLVEIQGEKVRKKLNWKKWVLPATMRFST